MLTLDHYQEILNKRDSDQAKYQKDIADEEQALQDLFMTIQKYCNFEGYCKIEAKDLCFSSNPIGDINLWLKQDDKEILTVEQEKHILYVIKYYQTNFLIKD